jgi:pimeloyl-ACP methyl ester carboxylesterase
MLLTAITAVPQAVSAAPPVKPANCDTSIWNNFVNKNIGTDVPVILVHGWWGSSDDWGTFQNQSSFISKVNKITGVKVIQAFNYDDGKWVTDPGNGPQLAKIIDCASQLSANNHGKGKVIVVGYSMGGLMAREALSHTAADGLSIASKVGQVITIATPHRGVAWTLPPPYQQFNAGSPELNALPDFPEGPIVHAIAADVTKIFYTSNGRTEVRREQPHDDTLVAVDSALAEYSVNATRGGASKIIYCDKKYRLYGWYTAEQGAATCQHDQLLKNSTVQSDTVSTIKLYLTWLNTPAPTSVTLTVGGLTTTYDGRWTHAEYGASGPGLDLSADDTTNATACTNCSDTPPPMVNAFIQVFDMSWCTNDTYIRCATGASYGQPVVGDAPAVTVGGLIPSSSARYAEGNPDGTSLAWCFQDKKICITYRRSSNGPLLQPSQALLDVFANAVWANP